MLKKDSNYVDCASSHHLQIPKAEFTRYSFESVRLGNPIKMVGGPNAEGVGQTNVNYFGNEEFGGEYLGADDNRAVKDTSSTFLIIAL